MAKKRTVKKTINLVDIFNRAYRDRDPSFREKIRPNLSRGTFKEIFGEEYLATILERTADNIDKNGKLFRHYSKSYAASDEFKAAKKRRSDPNLELTGSMLNSIRTKPLSRPQISMFIVGKKNNQKAHGHINGIPRGGGRVRRDFFGLPKKVEERIMRNTMRIFLG